jgi:molecular chaperone DnaK
MADSLIFQTEKQMKEFDEKLDETDKSQLTEKLDALKESHKSEDIPAIDQSVEALNETWGSISQKLYQATEEPTTEEDGSDDITDVDYEEVK